MSEEKKSSPETLYEQIKRAKPLFYPGKVLTEIEMKVIEGLFKRVRGLDAEMRDLLEQVKQNGGY